jgi:hypothetical protein
LLKVRVSLFPDDVSKDTALTNIVRESSKNGDEWDTDIVESDVIFPYFRVGQTTLITVAPSFLASSDYTTSVAGDILSLAQKAVALINPAVPLITAENKDRFTKAAGFVDETVNGLLHRSVKEHSVSVRIPTEMGPGGELAHVMLFSPPANRTIDIGQPTPVGMWTIRAEPLIASLFGTSLQNGRLIASNLSSTSILSFRVADNKSLQESLLAKNAITIARDAYIQATKADDKAKAGAQFCSVVAIEAGKIGFAPADVGGAAWAMAVELEPEPTEKGKLLAACAEADHFPVAT